MKIYTLTGDDGTTSLSGGRRVPKHSLRVEAYGSVDELIAWIGLLRSSAENKSRKEILVYIQDQLMRCAALLAHDSSNPGSRACEVDAACLSVLEKEIDAMEESLPPLRNFILPGGSTVVSYCHIARCVCRRAERAVLRLNEKEVSPAIVQKLLNRLSDYLFVLSRKIGLEFDAEEIKWQV
ncbi:MAG: cob(I)yrinic acid a,c-diamide adenosyltransferase [Bacteroidales bacterium]|jgi:cob(I)alamin adenosyltransferase|nr:cob(I)yrinic acid a,c-diamide adenosyltransferase [Bacteroidales bacterium]MCU0408199.1 cob(I)yrinic acid a,c-diamide adenosyltransferase [Bacteroidales bacterium]